MWRAFVLAIRAEGGEQRRSGRRTLSRIIWMHSMARESMAVLFGYSMLFAFIPSECAAYVRTISRLAQQRDAWDCGDGGCQ